ncbi:MAG: hypothetical protein HN919_06825 [Verrucomicrobia bacterium]|jgi:hypothetical protein|nr:hypothetical protein [Verrucomicrobiota bacterium]MBT7065997.1 hypothetical protein [Verrucomicrobiota bacterium]MBT7699326.1 hypothetical protein [Verrucomicrobiota bacterium]
MSTRLSLFLSLFVLSSLPATAQWQTQDIALEPGWNAVQLLVQPSQSGCSAVFSNTPVDRVFWWRKETTSFEFHLDPADLVPRSADWEYWFAHDSGASSFGALLAGETYQIMVDSNAAPFVLSVKGQVVLNPKRWVAGEQNLVGLPVIPGETMNFGDFFGFSPNFDINSSAETLFRVAADGSSQRIWQPFLTGIRRGEAYWVTAGDDASDFNGPTRVTLRSGGRQLDFGASVAPRTLVIENGTVTNRTIRIRQLPSEAPPADGGGPALIGMVPLVFRQNLTDDDYIPLPLDFVTNVLPESSLELNLAPDPARLTNGVADAAWQSVLSVTDENNTEHSVATVDSRLGVRCAGSLTELLESTGLWVGTVKAQKVNRARTRVGVDPTWDTTLPVPVSQAFEFRVIFHVNEAGETHLLQRVLVAWLPDGDVVDTPAGAYTNGVIELLSDETEAEAYLLAHPDATITRISSTCFPFMEPVAGTGGFGASASLVCMVELPYDDPVNPFVHRYHPDHDNQEYFNDVPTALGEGKESFTIQRTLWFDFSPTDPEAGAGSPQWGVTRTGGSFREQIQGLNKTIYVAGSFRLQKISDVGVLR